jgi:hypothetical protein
MINKHENISVDVYWEDVGVLVQSYLLLLFRSRLCHYSVRGAWLHLGVESYQG